MKRIILILVVALLPIAANTQYIGGARYNDGMPLSLSF